VSALHIENCSQRSDIHHTAKETLLGRQVKDMKKKSNYDGGLNYNMFFKPTCLYMQINTRLTKNLFLAGRLRI
jgi:hypothetical protein